MLTALISSVLGMAGGLLPDIMKEVRDTRSHTRELDLLKLQADLQVKVAQQAGDNRLREIEASSMAEQFKSMGLALGDIVKIQGAPTGIPWIDGLNSVLRPLSVLAIMGLFMATAVPYVYVVLGQMQAGVIDAKQMTEIIWGSLVGESILATMGFLFGYRTAAKR